MKNNSKLFDYFFSFMFIVLGIIIFTDQQTKDAFHLYDFSDHNLYIFVGLSLILFGLIWFYTTFKHIRKDEQIINYSKCQKCKTSYNYSELQEGICPTCNIKTIETQEYYKKYPDELKNI